MRNRSTGFFSNWSTLEYSLLAVVILLLCLGIGLAVVLLGGFFAEEETAAETEVAPIATLPPLPTPGGQTAGEEDVSLDPAATAAAGQPVPGDDAQTVSLSTPASAPGTTVTVQGEGWPAGSRVIISLVPSDPPNFTVNSAIVDGSGRFSTEMIVPSDARWLEESPVPVLVTSDNGLGAQTTLTIVAPIDSQPVATPASSNDVIMVGSGLEPNQPPPATVPQLTTTANLNVRAGPGTNYPVLGVLILGQQAEIIGRNENATWWQIKFPGVPAGFGWVSAEFAQASNIGNVPVVNAPPAPVQPPPAPTATPQPGLNITDWRGEYYNNPDLQGPPVLVRNDVAISFDWGLGSPGSGIPNDFFSVRWSRTADFAAGTYRFYTRVDDGVRLWVDGALLIDQWKEQSPTTYAADMYLAEGSHNLMMEYNELSGGATAILSWDRVDTYPNWKAEYFNNPNLEGAPVLVRNEGSINYNWGGGSAGPGLPADNFSARWTRVFYIDGGDYLFRISSDDGHRVFFDNSLILDNWRDGRSQVVEARRSIPSGLHEIRVEYYERSGDAFIGFAWQRSDRESLEPQAIIRAPGDGLVGQPVKFDGRRSRPGDSSIDKYDWDFGDGSHARGDKVSHTYRSPGEYRVRLTVTDENGLRDRSHVRIKIEQDLTVTTPPLALIDGPSTGTTGKPINFSGGRSQSLSPIVDYQWNFGDGTITHGQDLSHSFSRPGNYNVILTVIAENGLRGGDNLLVRIDDDLTGPGAPVAIIRAPTQGQTGLPVTFDATRSTAKFPIVSWQWNFGDGANANGPTVPHSFNAPGSYNVSLTVTDNQGQSNSANQVITIADPPPVNQPPVPAISGPGQTTTGQAITFDGSGSQSSNPITSYEWDFGDGSTDSGPQVTHTYSRVGEWPLTLVVTDDQGQQASTTQIIKVDPQPQPDPLMANINAPAQGQVGQSLTFDGQGSASSAPLNTIQWDFGDGGTDGGTLVVSHAYQQPGTYTVFLTLVNDIGQNNTTSQQVTIQDSPPANQPPQPVIQADATTIEAGDIVNFDASGTTAGSPIISYEWDFGDGSTGSGQLVSYDFPQPGSYDVTLTVTDQNGQSATATQSVTVNAKAQPDPLMANISAPATATAGQPVTFDGQQSTSAAPLNSIQWDFGDGSTAGGTSLSDLVTDHIYQQPGSYTVQLGLANDLNQTNTASFAITVQPAVPAPSPPSTPDQPQAEPPTAEIAGPDQAMVGEAVVFDGGYSQASSPIVQYQWGFGDGITANGMGATHAFAAPGSYTVTLNIVDENGLSSSASHVIEITGDAADQPAVEQPTPVPTSEPTEPPPQPTEEPAQPEQPSPTPEPTEPPAPQQPVEQPAPAQPPTAVIDGPMQVQAGVPVNFSSANSQPGSSAIVQLQWGFGDGSSDSQTEVSHTFPAAGQYQVTLTVVDENGLSDTAQLVVAAGPSQADLEAQQQAEEAQRQAEETQRQAEAQAQQQAAEEAQRQADQQAEQQAAAEATAQAEEAQRQAEEEAQQQAEEAQRQAEEEAQRQAEEDQRQAEEEAQRQTEEEAQRQAEEEAQRQAEEEARRQAEEAQRQAQEQQQQQQQDDSQNDEAGEGN